MVIFYSSYDLSLLKIFHNQQFQVLFVQGKPLLRAKNKRSVFNQNTLTTTKIQQIIS